MESHNSMKSKSKSNSPWSNSTRPGRRVDLPDECLFFIDDSNIWIEAQKYAAKANEHMPKLTDSDHDPRLRIDIGRLVTTLLRNENNKHRIQGKSFYYGSKPPPTDSVWKAAQKFNFEPKIYDKAASGREKEVDGSMGADISGISSDLSARADMEAQMEAKYSIDVFDHRDQINRTTFICITGDRDMMPAILKALNSGICVELWAWKDSMSKEFVKLETTMAHTSSLFSVHYLDGVFSEIFFTNYFSTRLGAKSVDPAKAVVLCDFVPLWYERYMFQSPTEAGPSNGSKSSTSIPSLPKDHKASPLEKAVCNKLILLGKVFYITRDTPAATSGVPPPPPLFIEFPRVEDRLIEKLLLRIRDSFRGIATVLSWPVYAGKTSRKTMPTTETSNMYAPLSGDDAHVHEEEDDNETAEDKGKDRNVDNIQIETLHIDDVASVGGDAVNANVTVNADHGLPSPSPSPSPSSYGGNGNGNGDADGSSEDASSSAGASAGWRTVTHFDRAVAHRRNRNRTQHCPFGLHCYKRGQCGNIHSHTDLLLFQEHPLQNFKRWKTEPCRYGDACANGRRCTYAHSVAEAQCLKCKGTGHYASGCKH